MVKKLLKIFVDGGKPKEQEEILWDQVLSYRWLVSATDEVEVAKMVKAADAPKPKAKAKPVAAKAAAKRSKDADDQAMAEAAAMFRAKKNNS